ncbi:hypothetical protein Tco_0478922, partial [Tanacetum coccineum]
PPNVNTGANQRACFECGAQGHFSYLLGAQGHFTWEREDHMKSKYPQLFVDRAVESAS